MDQFVTSSDMPAADPGIGPQNPEPAATSSESGAAEVVAVVFRGQQKSKLREEKLERVMKQLRNSQPSGASAPSLAYFECCVSGRLKEYGVCTLCVG